MLVISVYTQSESIRSWLCGQFVTIDSLQHFWYGNMKWILWLNFCCVLVFNKKYKKKYDLLFKLTRVLWILFLRLHSFPCMMNR